MNSPFRIHHSEFQRLALAALLVISLAGCAANQYVVHPGSVSTFDSKSYDALLMAQAAIDEGKAEYKAGTLPPASKDLLNKSVEVYNVAEASWHTYHDTASSASTGDVTKLQAELQADLDQLAAAISAFEQSAGKKAAPAIKP